MNVRSKVTYIMQTTAICLILSALSATVGFAQGTITFVNNVSSLRAPIYGPELDWVNYGGDWADAKTGNTAFGIPAGLQTYAGDPLFDYVVRFWAAPGIVSDGYLLQEGDVSTVTYGAGYFPVTSVTFQNLPASGIATVQVRVYGPDGSPKFGGDSAGGVSGVSALFTADIGSPAWGFRSFSVGWLDESTLTPHVPEPGLAVLISGWLGALALQRRQTKTL